MLLFLVVRPDTVALRAGARAHTLEGVGRQLEGADETGQSGRVYGPQMDRDD